MHLVLLIFISVIIVIVTVIVTTSTSTTTTTSGTSAAPPTAASPHTIHPRLGLPRPGCVLANEVVQQTLHALAELRSVHTTFAIARKSCRVECKKKVSESKVLNILS